MPTWYLNDLFSKDNKAKRMNCLPWEPGGLQSTVVLAHYPPIFYTVLMQAHYAFVAPPPPYLSIFFIILLRPPGKHLA